MDFALIAFLKNVVYLIVTLGLLRYGLYWLDRSMGINFKEMVWDVISKDSMALAVYHGLRFIGVCVVASAFLR